MMETHGQWRMSRGDRRAACPRLILRKVSLWFCIDFNGLTPELVLFVSALTAARV
jgi:hypothetical protein